MQRCKECGIPIQEGEFCSDICKEKWIKRENPEQFDDSEVDKEEDIEEVLLETHFSITPVNEDESENENEENISKEETIFDVVANSDFNALKDLINRGEDINQTNEYGYTPLHEAARVGDVRSSAFLLDAGADVNATNNKGWTPLHRASNYGNLDVVKLLVERNAQINLQEADRLVPLAISIEREHFDVARYLVVKGADPNCIDKKGVPVLMLALKKEQTKLAQLLIENGADPNSKAGNDSALLMLLKNGDLEFVKLLIEKGANPDISDAEGKAALIYALKYEYTEIAKLFIENGADVNCRDANGQTALHYAAAMQNDELVKAMLEKGAKPVVWNKYGQMPLHLSKSKNARKWLSNKMLPSKIVYSLRVLLLVFLLTSVTIPTLFAYGFSIVVFLAALVTDWPRKTSMRLYLLEILAVYLIITTTLGIYPDSFSYPYVFLLFPVAVFLVFNFFIRPVFVFFVTLNSDGRRFGFNEFARDFFITKLSFSPITALRTLNTLVIIVLLILLAVYNYDYLKKNDQYLLSHVFKVIPKRMFRSSLKNEDSEEVKIVRAVKRKMHYKSPEPGENKDFDRAMLMYLKKDFKSAIQNLSYAAEDPSVEGRAKELKLEIKRFSRLWERVNNPDKYKKRRGDPINRMIQYDKNISDGKLESEILMLKHAAK